MTKKHFYQVPYSGNQQMCYFFLEDVVSISIIEEGTLEQVKSYKVEAEECKVTLTNGKSLSTSRKEGLALLSYWREAHGLNN